MAAPTVDLAHMPMAAEISAVGAQPPAPCYLSVVVPAYNEEQRLAAMLTETVQYLQRREGDNAAFTWEIIVVDDGSKDSTAAKALHFSQELSATRVRVLRLAANGGKGAAVKEVRSQTSPELP